jgi:hypothetical protein
MLRGLGTTPTPTAILSLAVTRKYLHRESIALLEAYFTIPIVSGAGWINVKREEQIRTIFPMKLRITVT